MTGAERAAVLSLGVRLQNCTTDAQARLAFSDAVIDGAPFDHVIDAMTEWADTHPANVQTVSS